MRPQPAVPVRGVPRPQAPSRHPFDLGIQDLFPGHQAETSQSDFPPRRPHQQPALGRVKELTVLDQACYPTPPASPDLDLPALELNATPPDSGALVTVQLDDIVDLDSDDEEVDQQIDSGSESIDTTEETVKIETPPSVRFAPIPIPVILDTPHHLPQIAGFRLRSPASLLALTGGQRSLELDFHQSLWDRMPYSAAAAAIHARQVTDEDMVEAIVGGEKPEKRVNSLQWSLRQKSNDRSSIFIHPPTPERDSASPRLDAAKSASSAASSPDVTAEETTVDVKIVPSVNVASPPNGNRTMPVPLQVLPEVRSPPRRTIPMAVEALPVLPKRTRRPRMFGFTEMPDSGSSAGSSAANSRNTSPERPSSPALPLPSPSASPGPASQVIPRRQHPIRARSETHLPTISSTSGLSAPPISSSNVLQPPSLPSPRRRENGLKLDFTGIIPIASAADAQSSVIPSPYSAKLIRKKSGEILKPALKYGGPLATNGTPLEGPRTDISPASPASARFESKSCPTTPSCPKYVHFDAQLERVKLFLHDQKPEIVSRSGSPNEHWTTSEGEEYPFPSTDEEREDKRILQIKLPNFPTYHAPDTDLYLESLFLDDDRKSLRGMMLCKNYSYQKWVAVRFTFDFWQTTSEVTASHKDVVKGGKYDRFSFVIKLGDILPRIEEKTMFLAIRYNTDGREIWDSNGGQNYQVLFEKVKAVNPITVPKRNSVSIQPGMGKAIGGRTSQWSVTGGNADDRLADLRAKLSRLSADDMSTSPPQLSPNRSFAMSPNRRGGAPLRASGGSPNASPQRSFSSLDTRTSDLPSAGGALAARYDFGAALKTARKTSPSMQKVELPDVQTGLINYARVNKSHAATEFYSPRFSPNPLPGGSMPETFYNAASVGSSDSLHSMNGAQVPDALAVPDLKVSEPSPPLPEEKTPVSKPLVTGVTASPKRPALARSATSPAAISPRDSPSSLDTFGSGLDTPSESPRSPLDDNFPRWSPGNMSDKRDDMSHASYSSFIEQFCWGGAAQSPPRRTQSSSSLDAYFANNVNGYGGGSHTPPLGGATTPRPSSFPSAKQTPTGTSTPSSTSSYFTSYSRISNGRDDFSGGEEGLGLEIDRGSPRFAAVRMDGMEMGRMSPSVAC